VGAGSVLCLREMTLATLTQCETRWQDVIASFSERYDIVRTGQLVQNSPKVNDNGAKWKQLTDRAEADRYTFCKLLALSRQTSIYNRHGDCASIGKCRCTLDNVCFVFLRSYFDHTSLVGTIDYTNAT
jgi:hypothetical protein